MEKIFRLGDPIAREVETAEEKPAVKQGEKPESSHAEKPAHETHSVQGFGKKPIVRALSELKNAMLQISLLTWFLDSLVIFTVSELVLMLLTLPWDYAFVPAGIYSAVHAFHVFKKVRYQYAEEKVPELKEQLITAADYVDKDSELLQGLNKEVLEKMKQIRTSYFFSFGKLTRELFMLFFCSFLIIGASAYHIRLISVNDVVRELQEVTGIAEYEVDESELFFEEGNETADNIYGNKSIAELGNEEFQLQLNPVLSDADISQVNDPEERKFNSNVPREIVATTDASYEEGIPKGYQKIVKSYFREITKVR